MSLVCPKPIPLPGRLFGSLTKKTQPALLRTSHDEKRITETNAPRADASKKQTLQEEDAFQRGQGVAHPGTVAFPSRPQVLWRVRGGGRHYFVSAGFGSPWFYCRADGPCEKVIQAAADRASSGAGPNSNERARG